MKKLTFIVAAALASVIYLGTSSQSVVASSNKGIVSDTSKKEKKVESKALSSSEKPVDSTSTEKK